MILSFKTKINEKPTHFVYKIWKSLIIHELVDTSILAKYIREFHQKFGKQETQSILKLHTIREDKNNRWKAGKNIHFFINARQKSMFQFAPVIPVLSTQKIEIKVSHNPYGCNYSIYIDGFLIDKNMAEKLALNDGFESLQDFQNYFNKNFSGKIIHWTNLKY